ncbi:MAG: PKD domain-containing protein [Bacteroidia bacterium]
MPFFINDLSGFAHHVSNLYPDLHIFDKNSNMKKQISIVISIFLLVSLSKLAYSQNLVLKDTVKACERKDPKELDRYLINGLSHVKWEGQGVVQLGNSFYFDMVGLSQGIYELLVTATLNGNTTTDTLWVLALNTPEVHAGNYDSICVNDNAFLLDKASPSGPTGKWFYQGLDKTRWDSILNEADPASLKPGTHFYAYVYTVPNTVCRDTAYTSLTINPLPKPMNLTQWHQNNGKNSICINGNPKQLESNSMENGVPYLDRVWSGRGVRPLTSARFEFSPANAGLGEHTLTYSATNIYGCVNSITDNVIVESPAEIEFNYNRNGLTVSFSNLSNNASFFEWDFGDDTYSTDSNPTHTYADTGKYTVILSTKDYALGKGNSCKDLSLTKNIEIYPVSINEIKKPYLINIDHQNHTVAIKTHEDLVFYYNLLSIDGKTLKSGTTEHSLSLSLNDGLSNKIFVFILNTNDGKLYREKIILN